ncbi:MAG: hypothetical protein KDB90_01095 [Planctomycetes bacterium]|nr:hypothetical protein [Planctomycetota bacterium]
MWAFKYFREAHEERDIGVVLVAEFADAEMVSDSLLFDQLARVIEAVGRMGYKDPQNHPVVVSDRGRAEQRGPGALWKLVRHGVRLRILITKNGITFLGSEEFNREDLSGLGEQIAHLIVELPEGDAGGPVTRP